MIVLGVGRSGCIKIFTMMESFGNVLFAEERRSSMGKKRRYPSWDDVERIVKKCEGKSLTEIQEQIEVEFKINSATDIDFFDFGMFPSGRIVIDGCFSPDELRRIAKAAEKFGGVVDRCLEKAKINDKDC
jgi:hypothetical protein